jgi:RHS repeat-associated protein
MLMPGRTYNAGTYRYAFNGMEQDQEVKGRGNSLDFGARMYDPRVGRFFSLDPKDHDYPDYSPYGFAANNPIIFIDHNGEFPALAIPYVLKGGAVVIIMVSSYIVARSFHDYWMTINLDERLFRPMGHWSPEYDHQRRQERAAKELARLRDLAFMKMLNDNMPQNDPHGKDPDRYRKIIDKFAKGAVVFGGLELLYEMRYILFTERVKIESDLERTRKIYDSNKKENLTDQQMKDRRDLFFKIKSLEEKLQINTDALKMNDEMIDAEQSLEDYMDPQVERQDKVRVKNLNKSNQGGN